MDENERNAERKYNQQKHGVYTLFKFLLQQRQKVNIADETGHLNTKDNAKIQKVFISLTASHIRLYLPSFRKKWSPKVKITEQSIKRWQSIWWLLKSRELSEKQLAGKIHSESEAILEIWYQIEVKPRSRPDCIAETNSC